MTDLESRVRALEAHMSDVRVKVSEIEGDLRSNTERTNEIKRDTAEIIDLLRGGKVFGRITAWVLGLTTAAGAVVAAVKGFGAIK